MDVPHNIHIFILSTVVCIRGYLVFTSLRRKLLQIINNYSEFINLDKTFINHI